ncbi:mucin TcMUCII [Trypanosoma cruzi]|nr:mucin TcMUCII [Trypanosoma cruzi]
MRMPQWRHRLLNRRLARRLPPKSPGMPAGKTPQEAQTRALEMDQALPPPPHNRRHGLLIPDGPRETPPHPLRECPRRWEYGLRLFGTAPARRTFLLRQNDCHFCADGPCATHSLL